MYLKNARPIDGNGTPAVPDAALVIEGHTIVHAGPLSAADAPGSDARVVEAGVAARIRRPVDSIEHAT